MRADTVVRMLQRLENSNHYRPDELDGDYKSSEGKNVQVNLIVGKDDVFIETKPSGIFAKMSAFFSDLFHGRTRDINKLGGRIVSVLKESSSELDTLDKKVLADAKTALLGLKGGAKNKEDFDSAIKIIESHERKSPVAPKPQMIGRPAQPHPSMAKNRSPSPVQQEATSFVKLGSQQPIEQGPFLAKVQEMCTKYYANDPSLLADALKELNMDKRSKTLSPTEQREILKYFEDLYQHRKQYGGTQRSNSSDSFGSTRSSAGSMTSVSSGESAARRDAGPSAVKMQPVKGGSPQSNANDFIRERFSAAFLRSTAGKGYQAGVSSPASDGIVIRFTHPEGRKPNAFFNIQTNSGMNRFLSLKEHQQQQVIDQLVRMSQRPGMGSGLSLEQAIKEAIG